jgi:hypothetical protein
MLAPCVHRNLESSGIQTYAHSTIKGWLNTYIHLKLAQVLGIFVSIVCTTINIYVDIMYDQDLTLITLAQFMYFYVTFIHHKLEMFICGMSTESITGMAGWPEEFVKNHLKCSSAFFCQNWHIALYMEKISSHLRNTYLYFIHRHLRYSHTYLVLIYGSIICLPYRNLWLAPFPPVTSKCSARWPDYMGQFSIFAYIGQLFGLIYSVVQVTY